MSLFVGQIIRKKIGRWGSDDGNLIIVVDIENGKFNYRYFEFEEHGIGHDWKIEEFFEDFEHV